MALKERVSISSLKPQLKVRPFNAFFPACSVSRGFRGFIPIIPSLNPNPEKMQLFLYTAKKNKVMFEGNSSSVL